MTAQDTADSGRAQRPASQARAAAADADAGAWRERATMLVAIAAYAGLSGLGGLLLPNLAPVLLAADHATRSVGDQEIMAAIVALLVLPAALAMEALATGWRASSLRRMVSGSASPSIKTDIAFLALSHVQFTDIAGKVMMLAASMAAGLWLRGRIARQFGFEIDPSGFILPAQIVLYFVVFSFLDYWAHRLYHTPVFWPLHRYHHAATEFSVINGERAHPAAVLGIFLINLPMAALGASPLVLIYVNALAQGQSLLIHSRIDSGWGWFGRWVLQSPNHHRSHHKLDIGRRPTGNFSMAPIWDRLFGTWDEAADPSLAIGVDTPYRHGLWIWPDVWRDLRDFCRGLAHVRPARDA